MRFIIGEIKNCYSDNDLDGYYTNLMIENEGIIYDLHDIYLLEFLKTIDRLTKNSTLICSQYWDHEDYGTVFYDKNIPYISFTRNNGCIIIKIRWIERCFIVGSDKFSSACQSFKNDVYKFNKLIIGSI